MTEMEAIKQFKDRIDIPDYKEQIPEYYEAMEMAINALEKQEKIKEAFTHYAFSGFEMDVLSDCLHCLAEIKDILKGSEEE